MNFVFASDSFKGSLSSLKIGELLTQAAQDVFARTGDAAVAIPEGFQGGALDFASSLFSWVIFHLVHDFKWVGSGILVVGTTVMAILNRRRIIKASYEKNNDSSTAA